MIFRHWKKSVLGLLGTGLMLGAGFTHAQDTVRLKMAHIYPPGNIWYEAAANYAKAVEEKSGGKVTIAIAHSGSTGDYPQAIEGLKMGTNDIVLQSIGTLDRYDPLPGVEAFPYTIRDVDHFKAVYFGPVGKEFSDELAKRTGFRIIGAGYRGARWLTSNRAVSSLDDLKGLKLRVPPLKMYRMTWDLLGASTVPMGATELFTSLQQGVIDGQENPLEMVSSFKLDEVQGHATDTRHVIGAMTWIYSDARLKRLPEDMQELLREEGEKAMHDATDRMVAMEADLRDELVAKGMQMHDIDRNAMQERLADLGKEFPDLQPWVEKFRAVQ